MAKKNKKEVDTIQPEIKQGGKYRLTLEEKTWSDYLKRINTTPEEFLNRYPDHPFKNIIKKLK